MPKNRYLRVHECEGRLMEQTDTSSWTKALNRYSYFVDLRDYRNHNCFPGYFLRVINGDRRTTIEFEDYFRRNAQQLIEVYFEVVFWKLYSQPMHRQKLTAEIISNMLEGRVEPRMLHDAINRFMATRNLEDLKEFRKLLGIKTHVLAVALTFPAFLSPETHPMVDNNVAYWVNENHSRHNRNRQARLTPFALGKPSLMDNDFDNYLNWVNWCREIAEVLRERTGFEWRTRDVEMAVFTSYRSRRYTTPLKLSVL